MIHKDIHLPGVILNLYFYYIMPIVLLLFIGLTDKVISLDIEY
jgi:hypothetical protein